MKKVLAMTLALTLAFGAVALPAVESGITFSTGISASAEDDVLVSGDYQYVIQDDGTVAITKYTGNETNVDIPEKINNTKVTAIGTEDFFGNNTVENITIPDSITFLGLYAFSFCRKLTNIKLSNNLTNISGQMFKGTNLTSITIPNKVTSINYLAFLNCTNLKEIFIPNSVKNIGEQAFGYKEDIVSGELVKVKEFKIKCHKNSEAERYAISNGFEYDSHDYSVKVIKEPTCTESGVKELTCECGDKYTETISANGHTFGEWTVTKSVTCTEDGEE